MLQNIRDRFTGGFAIAILALLCIPFVFFGINYDFTGSSKAATVNGDDISMAVFDNAYRRQLADYAEMGGELPDELRSMLKENVLNNLVWDTLVQQYLAEKNYRISDSMITEFIRNAPEFQADGKFSRENYYAWLAERSLEATIFEANQRYGLRESQLQRGIGATAFVTPAEYRRYLNLYREEREVSIATFDVDAIAETVEVTDEQIQDYYDSRPAEFQSPESVDFKYLELRRDALRRQIDVTEEEVRAYYEEQQGRYLQDEQRRARHILIPFGDDEAAAREQAEALAERVRAGESFADLAREYSADSSSARNGGDLGPLLHSQLPGALGDAIYAMRTGEIAGPVRSDFGFHVIRLDDIQAGGPLPLEEVRPELERELRAEKAETIWRQARRELSDALFDAESIEAMANATDLPVQQATGYTRSGGEPFGSNQAAIDAIFSDMVLDERRISDIIELDANRSAVVQVTEYHEASRKPLAEVREQIVDAVRMERARAIISEKTSELQAALRDGQTFESAAAAVEADEISSTVMRRDDTEADPGVRNAVFRVKKPQPGEPRIGTAATSDGNQAVFAVTDWSPGRPEAIPVEQRDQGKRELAQRSGQSDYTALVFELERRADVERNRQTLEQQYRFE